MNILGVFLPIVRLTVVKLRPRENVVSVILVIYSSSLRLLMLQKF